MLDLHIEIKLVIFFIMLELLCISVLLCVACYYIDRRNK